VGSLARGNAKMNNMDAHIMEEEPARQIEGELDIAVAPEAPVLQEEEAYRYRLKAPIFIGLEDVEQFIQ